MVLVGVFSLYWIWEHPVPIYGRIYRDAPVIEIPYLAFGLLMAPHALSLAVIGASVAAWTGKKFDPPNKSPLFRFQALVIYTSVKTILYVVPTLVIATTLVMLAETTRRAQSFCCRAQHGRCFG